MSTLSDVNLCYMALPMLTKDKKYRPAIVILLILTTLMQFINLFISDYIRNYSNVYKRMYENTHIFKIIEY